MAEGGGGNTGRLVEAIASAGREGTAGAKMTGSISDGQSDDKNNASNVENGS